MSKTELYSADSLRRNLWDSALERNQAFGYNSFLYGRTQSNYHDNALCRNKECGCGGPCPRVATTASAPSSYYNDLRVDGNQKAVIGDLTKTPNLYDDNVLPGSVTRQRPQLYRNWDPNGSKSIVPQRQNTHSYFVRHKPVEVAPVHDERLWTADLNSQIHERSLLNNAEPHPNANYYKRQALVNMLAQNWKSNTDSYSKPIHSYEDTFAARMTQTCGKPPAVTGF